ncbi:MAG: orotidine-5'-phosphate decarboxylase [Acidobacteria bacterium]|nr:orotidine-5'-phosphate decarboxylase [Acidobacteriota bacterium]
MTNKLIIALDVDTAARARELFAALRDYAGMFKVGSQLFTAAGPEIVREIVSAGSRVFLDLKFHDIPNTVAAAAREAARLGVTLFNVHAFGGREMMRRAAEAAAETADREGLARPSLLAVTVLTSADAATLSETGINFTPEAQAALLARLAASCGVDGVVASAHEVRQVRSVVTRDNFLVVTPGVRRRDAARDDQKRVMTPADAVRAGADYIVMGRSVINAPDPAAAAREVAAEIASAEAGAAG